MLQTVVVPHLETLPAFQKRDRRLQIEFAYLKQLPREYSGPRHIVTVDRRPNGREECEERPGEPPPDHERTRERRGAPPASEDGPTWIIRISLVRAKDGRPDYSWPEDAHS